MPVYIAIQYTNFLFLIKMSKKIWDIYKNKKVRLYIIDGDKIRPRDGVFIDYDDTHVIMKIDNKDISFLRNSIKRIEGKD